MLSKVKNGSAISNGNGGNTVDKFTFQKLFERQAGSTVVVSPTLHIQAATDTFVSETGLEREEVLGGDLFEVLQDCTGFGQEFLTTLQETLLRTIEDKKPHYVDGPLRFDVIMDASSYTPEERYWRFSTTPLLNESNEVESILLERIMANQLYRTKLQLEEELRKKELTPNTQSNSALRLDPILRNLPLSVIILEGPDLVYADSNEASVRLFPEKPRIGLPLLSAFPELKGKPIIDKFRHCYSTGETFEEKELLIPVARKHDGPIEDFYWHLTCQALFDENQEVAGLLIFALDVTSNVLHRVQAEQDTRTLIHANQALVDSVKIKAEELEKVYASTDQRIKSYHSLFMQAPVGIAILKGKDYVVEFANPLIGQLVGRSLEEVLNKPVFEALPEVRG